MRTHIRSYSVIIVLLLAAVMLIGLFSVPARAAGPWYVAPTGSDGSSCLSPGSPCATINGAIGKASSGDTIYVATGTYTSSSGVEVVLIDRSITLSGGWDSTFTTQTGTSTIDGGRARRGITINDSQSANIERFTIQHGWVANGDGGGIYNAGSMTLNSSIVNDNTAYNQGGGIYNYTNTMTLNNSTISFNTSQYSAGGGVYNFGGLATLQNSTISDNTGSFGGGIYKYSGTMILNNCTVSGNSSLSDRGGGIFNFSGDMTLNNSTISGNTSSSDGGGIVNHYDSTMTLNNSTVTSNTAYTFGGGIRSYIPVTLQNSILAGNISLGTDPDCYGPISSAGYNLIGNTTCLINGDLTGNITGVDPMLGPLQNNGGTTLTHALLQGSPAINAGNPAGCTDQLGNPLTADQRGKPRVGRCDVGAYELQPLGFSTKLADRQISHHGEAISYTITLDNPGAAEITGVQLSDALPAHLGYVNGSLSASKGQAAYQNGVISWNGTLSAEEQVQVVFTATVDNLAPLNQPITNTAEIQGGGEVFLRDAAVLVESYQIALPVILRPCLPLYSDNFSNPASGWFVGDDGDYRYEYLNGEYRILVRPTQGGRRRSRLPGFGLLGLCRPAESKWA